MTIRTQAAEHAKTLIIERVRKRGPLYEPTMAALFGGTPNARPVEGLGDGAHLTLFTSGDAILEVLAGSVLLHFSLVGFRLDDPGVTIERVARMALQRLPA